MNKLGIETVWDLLTDIPRDYEVYDDIVPIAKVRIGEPVIVEASLRETAKIIKTHNIVLVTCQVQDYSGILNLTWFRMPFLRNQLKMGTHYIFRGKVVRKYGSLVMEQPKILKKEEYVRKLQVLQPVYSLTEGLTNHALSKAVESALREYDFEEDYLPASYRKEKKLQSYKWAFREVHFPKDRANLIDARKRLVFDEFVQFFLRIQYFKEKQVGQKVGILLCLNQEINQFINKLPYELTRAQRRVWEEIQTDLCKETSMNRLLQGDVGSGKTMIAVLALFLTVCNHAQGSLMVPTEVLAKQHFETLNELYQDTGIRVQLLVGSMTPKEKKEAYKKIADHEVDIVVGTHALIQDKVEYSCLALVITDEQHRFGVKQRESLAQKGNQPHVLVMSATPIPRTLAVILYGDLDISVIDELPTNRKPIKNCVVNTNYRSKAIEFISKEIGLGHQAYIICPMVEESEHIEAENVLDYAEKLHSILGDSIRIEYLHGKMNATRKNALMEEFVAGRISILVATTVIEVGINVPNATVILVENAERFGLAQLHQLRGRVGRGSDQSYCIFMNGTEGEETMDRLEILNHSNDGFYIAQEDLKLRGAGDVFGIRQSGVLDFKIGDIYQDAELLKEAGQFISKLNEHDREKLAGQFEQMTGKHPLVTQMLAI